MEIAILIEREEEYKGNCVGDYHIPWGSKENGLRTVCRNIEKYKDNKIDYIYFGNEFCEYRIPSVEQLVKVLAFCKKDNIKCVLVTPVVTDYGLERLSLLIDFLVENEIIIDVVINDMGVLELVRRKLFGGNVIVGRILEKSSHDCRASGEELNNYYGENGKRFAKTPGVISRYSQMVYGQYGVERFEFDLPKIGLDLPKGGNYSLYWPYSYLTTGRVCLLRSLDLKGKDKFLVGEKNCTKECLKYRVEKRKPMNGYSSSEKVKKKDLFLFQKGNTLFFINDETEFSMDCFNRLIIQL